MLLIGSLANAETKNLSASQPADMHAVLRYLRADPRPDSKEAFTTRAADEAASGLTAASRLAFLGAVKVEASRSFTKPGVTDTVNLPLPPQLGGPQSADIVLVPRVQNEYTVGWTIPIFSLQALRGLRVAARGREQQTTVASLERESVVRTKINLMLQYELAQKLRSVRKDQVAVAQSRLGTVQSRVDAGLARHGQKAEAEASLASAKAELALAETSIQRLNAEFRERSGEVLPPDGLGIPNFPFTPDRPFDPLAVKALTAAAAIREATAETVDAAFAPTVDGTVARDVKQYDGAPDPQNSFGLKLSWLLLDAGTRRRNASDERRAMYQARADAADLTTELRSAYATLKARRSGADFTLKARQAAVVAADQGVQDSAAAYATGSGRLIDVRNADDQRFSAELGVFQAEVDLQAIAVESLVLSGNLIPFVERGGQL